MTGLAKPTVLITGFTFLGLCLGFLSNLLVASKFGTGPNMDAYLAATTLPSLIGLILTTSLASTFIPVFTEYRESDPEEARRLAGIVANLAAWAGLGFCVTGIVFSIPLARLLAPGLSPGQAEMTAEMIRWLLPGVVLTILNEIISGVYYANGKFLMPAWIRVLGPLSTLSSVWYLASALSVRSLVLATLSATALQTIILTAGLFKNRLLLLSLRPDFRHPAVKKILGLMAPMALAMCFYKLGSAFERWLASGMSTGSISMLGYATKLTQVLQPVLISGISISGFALMARHVSKRDMEGLRATLAKSCGLLFFVSVPLAVLLSGFGRPLVAFLFERGAFTPQDTLTTSRLFSLYILVLPASTAGSVVAQAMYAFQNTRIPTLIGILDFFLFAALGLLLSPRFGLLSLPISFGLSYYATTLLLCVLLSRKTRFSVLALFRRPLFTALVASGAALGLGLVLEKFYSGSRLWPLACLGFSVLSYFLIQRFFFKSPEARRLLELFRDRLPFSRPG